MFNILDEHSTEPNHSAFLFENDYSVQYSTEGSEMIVDRKENNQQSFIINMNETNYI